MVHHRHGNCPFVTASQKCPRTIDRIDNKNPLTAEPVFVICGFLRKPAITGTRGPQDFRQIAINLQIRLGHGGLIILEPGFRVAAEKRKGNSSRFHRGTFQKEQIGPVRIAFLTCISFRQEPFLR